LRSAWSVDDRQASALYPLSCGPGRERGLAGTPARGHNCERAIDKHFATIPFEDQVAGLKALGQRFPELDLERVGITGWSFGGYLSALAVLRRPDVYNAAVAGAPVVDWLGYEPQYTDRRLGMHDTH